MLTDLPYDPEARRETPLALRLKERIRREGPISVAEYMTACLQDPEHGYYRTKAAIGAKGDFITAPEISQVFGELIGLWCAVVWQQMGSPPRVNLVELGPGRGTLMRDALRAAKVVPGFREAIALHLVESNEALAFQQREMLDALHVWPSVMSAFEGWMLDAPAIVVGNEFIDAQADILQWLRTETEYGWQLRTVALDARGELAFLWRDAWIEDLPTAFPSASAGEIYELRRTELWATLGGFAGREPTAALFIDYGHEITLPGDTLQAMRSHAFEHPLTSPGEADLTTLVDFEKVADGAKVYGFAVDGPVTQAEFLGSLGIVERASKLMGWNPAKAAEIEMGVARLMAVPGMGSRFKAIGLRSKSVPPLPGF